MQCTWLFVTLLLKMPIVVCAIQKHKCLLKKERNFYHDGNVLIAGFFPLHIPAALNRKTAYQIIENRTPGNSLQNYQLILALEFAIQEINKNSHLLQNTSLGFVVYDSLFTEYDVLVHVFHWLTGLTKPVVNYNCREEMKTVAVLTGTSWVTSAHIATLLELYRFPQLTFGPFDTLLSDQNKFSSLYQVVPKDTFLSRGIVSLILHFSWTWVGILTSDDHKGSQILTDFREEFHRNQVCIAFSGMIPVRGNSNELTTWNDYEKLEKSSANVIIIYGDADTLVRWLLYIGNILMTGKVLVSNFQWELNIELDYFIFDSFHGTLFFSQHHKEISDFTKFVQTVTPFNYPGDFCLPKIWHMYFNCSFSGPNCEVLDNCLPNASLELLHGKLFDMHMMEESYNIYNAVYAVAHSLHEMTLNLLEIQPGANENKMTIPWQLHAFLKHTEIQNGVGEKVVLDSKRKFDAEYDILNAWNFPRGLALKMKVGTFTPSAPLHQQLSLNEQLIQWATGFTEIPKSSCSESCSPGFRKTHQEGKSVCCFDCIPCTYNEISNETDMDQCVKCPENKFANTKQDRCLQKAVTFLSYEDPLGMTLTSIALVLSAITAAVLGIFVKHRETPIVKANNRALSYILLLSLIFCFLCSLLFIGHPNTATCILQQHTFGVLFTVALSTVLAKTMTVLMAFRMTTPSRMIKWFKKTKAPNFIIVLCTLIQLILCGIWLGTSPPFTDVDTHSEHGHIIIVCNKGSIIAFHCVLGYLCSLALGSYTMAFLSRNLPDTFNEAKLLTFSMLVFCSVWITFLPVYHSTKGKVMVAMEVFSILASSAGILGCIFAPKCYIILLKPERNSVAHIRDKKKSRYKNPLYT